MTGRASISADPAAAQPSPCCHEGVRANMMKAVESVQTEVHRRAEASCRTCVISALRSRKAASASALSFPGIIIPESGAASNLPPSSEQANRALASMFDAQVHALQATANQEQTKLLRPERCRVLCSPPPNCLVACYGRTDWRLSLQRSWISWTPVAKLCIPLR